MPILHVFAYEFAEISGSFYSVSPDDDFYIHISKVYSYSHHTMHLVRRVMRNLQPYLYFPQFFLY